MLIPFDWVLFVLITLGLPVRAWFSMQRLKRSSAEALALVRPRLYGFAMLTQWSLSLAVLALWIWQRREWGALGLELKLGGGLVGVLTGLFTISLLAWRQRGLVTSDPDMRARVRARLAGVQRLLPTNDGESRWFAALAVTAGICEELLFRGFVLWLLTHFLPYWGAAVVQAILFGVGHAYQGVKGIVATAIAGAFLTGVLIVSGSVYAAMLAHALMDLHAGNMGRRAFAPPDSHAA